MTLTYKKMDTGVPD